MSWFSALIMLATGVVLPTLDVYTDIEFAFKMLMWKPTHYTVDECNRYRPGWQGRNQKYATAILTPPIISWLFVAYQWLKTEVGVKQKLMTLPFLLLQVYPQWRALRVLYYGKWKKIRGWQRIKEDWETGISNLGRSPYHIHFMEI